jgi:DNA polymerase-3 subunit epsilon
MVIVDLETTGFSPTTASITEIGAVKVRAGKILAEFQTFVNPGVSIPAKITEMTGITDDHVRDAPHPSSALDAFLAFAGFADYRIDSPDLDTEVFDLTEEPTILVAHNAPFDVGFLKHNAFTFGIDWPLPPILDTVKFAGSVLSKSEIANLKLDTLAKHFNVSVSPTHRALDDAKATVEVLWNLMQLAHEREIKTNLR